MEDGELIEFTAEVDTRPEITIPDFSTIAVEVEALKSDEDAIEDELTRLRERFAELSDTKRKLKTDDFAIIDLEATVDGEPLPEANAEGLSYKVGAGDLIDGLDTALRGLKTGESAEFTTTLKHGEHEGKEANVTVKVIQTKERKLPELDEDFVQMASEFDTVEELRESLAERVGEQAKAQQAAQIRDKVLEAAIEAASFPVPQGIVEEQAHQAYHQVFGQLAHDEEAVTSFLKAQGSSREQFEEEARKNAEESVRNQLFLDALADQEQPEVSQAELTDHILFTAQSYGVDPGQFVAQLQQSGQIANLFADVRRGKALAAAICRVSVKDDAGNSLDPSEYFGVDEDTDEATED